MKSAFGGTSFRRSVQPSFIRHGRERERKREREKEKERERERKREREREKVYYTINARNIKSWTNAITLMAATKPNLVNGQRN